MNTDSATQGVDEDTPQDSGTHLLDEDTTRLTTDLTRTLTAKGADNDSATQGVGEDTPLETVPRRKTSPGHTPTAKRFTGTVDDDVSTGKTTTPQRGGRIQCSRFYQAVQPSLPQQGVTEPEPEALLVPASVPEPVSYTHLTLPTSSYV